MYDKDNLRGGEKKKEKEKSTHRPTGSYNCNLCKQKPFWILLAVVILLHNPSAPELNILTFTAKLKYISK